MVNKADKNQARLHRHRRVRGKISGTAECPRLNVYRSTNNIYAQLIDDVKGVTLCSASTLDKDFDGNGGNKEAARKVGLTIAQRAVEKGISEVVFDRGGHIYHGRVKEFLYLPRWLSSVTARAMSVSALASLEKFRTLSARELKTQRKI